MGPYTSANRIATIPPECLDGKHRCEIGNQEVRQLVPPACQVGVSGNCVVVDMNNITQTTRNHPQVYYYVLTAVRNVQESGFSEENQGRPSCSDCYLGTGWHVVYDPDNSPEAICGDESAALRLGGESIAEAGLGTPVGCPASGSVMFSPPQ